MTTSDDHILPVRRESEQLGAPVGGLRMVAALESGANPGHACLQPTSELAVSLEGLPGADMSPHEPAQEADAPSQLAKGAVSAVSLASRGDQGSLPLKLGAGPGHEGHAQPREVAKPRQELPGAAAPPQADAPAARQQQPGEAASPNGLAQPLDGGQPQQREPPQVQEPAAEAAEQQQAAAAAAQPPDGTPASTPAAPPADVLSPAESKAVAELEAILGRISQLDAEGWFQAPVREADAPNYYSTIKHPMCFQVRESTAAASAGMALRV